MEMAENWMQNINSGMEHETCCYLAMCDRAGGDFIGFMRFNIFRAGWRRDALLGHL
jgi:hypothetical protein